VADFVNAIMTSIWADDEDAADPKVLSALASRHGLDGVQLLAEAGTETVQAEYRDNTRRALSAGVFGSPFYLFGGEVFWGQDRLVMLEEAIVRSRTADLGRRPALLPGPG
jgi:2-hydroxychromene-2-carboxylate isomerase